MRSEMIDACCHADAPPHIVRALTESDAEHFGTTCDTVARLLLQCRGCGLPWPRIGFDGSCAYLSWDPQQEYIRIGVIVHETDMCIDEGHWGVTGPKLDIAQCVTLLDCEYRQQRGNV
jgi:hypothetical protein